METLTTETRAEPAPPRDEGPYYVANLDKSALNIAPQLSGEQRKKLGAQICEDYDEDVMSCGDYMDERAMYSKAFSGKKEPRPDGIANLHVPLITVGGSQFAARELEAIAVAKGLVNVKATGGEDERRADRVGRHMNFQLQHQVEDFLTE